MPVRAALSLSILSLSVAFVGPLLAQIPSSPGSFICSYTGGKAAPDVICSPTTPSNGHAERVVDRILKPIGLLRNFKVIECANTSNCFATVLKGQRFIVYDGAFMAQIEEETETDWSAISIMAHEIGHHLQGHTIDGRGGQPIKEIEADKFSGFVLHQLGASLEDATVAVKALGDEHATSTHPAKPARIEAIRKGWLEAEAMYPKSRTAVKTPTAMAPKPMSTNTSLAASSRPVVAPAAPVRRAGNRVTVGCVSGDCQDGTGVFVYPTLERYAGEFEEGDKHGEGTEYYADGKVKYKGNFRDNLRSDYGVYYYRNGDKYVGWFQNNIPNGKGTYYFADGDKIVATFKNGQPVQ
ncbi:M48 family metalloprotease [Spirosoma sp. KCTC 42546]|uniref:M48 family metalloprotease n=1 Tax=Spirosoma sp. KCTC 42546 TaxID=2520506 RepID=UPI00115BB68C|nr:M48 family metalloprotease [Spirosoma sp. KCTC 42546]QDK77241.1 M48 family metalloprotease [Spirosoma sp. KCTC 42546]